MIYLFILCLASVGCSRQPRIVTFIIEDDFAGEILVLSGKSGSAEQIASNNAAISVPSNGIVFLGDASLLNEWHVLECRRKSGERVEVVGASMPFPSPTNIYLVSGSSTTIDSHSVHRYFIGDQKGFCDSTNFKSKEDIQRIVGDGQIKNR
jgi:hypothetical protein